jgi:replicative DNA helicase Mcm
MDLIYSEDATEPIIEVETPINPEIKDITSFKMNSRSEGKMFSLKGMLFRKSDIYNEIYADKYYCQECDNEFEVEHNKPTRRCSSCNSTSILKRAELERDFIEFEVEEIPEEITTQPGRIKVKAYAPLVFSQEIEEMSPGEIIKITARVSKDKLKIKNGSEIFEYFLLLDTIETSKRKDMIDEITEEEMKQIIEISKNNPLDKLSKSLAPNIHDMEDIKKSLVLQMARGPQGVETLRSNINILLIGEPGLAKSQIANQASKRVYRSIFGSGESMTRAGFLVSMEKEEISGRWSVRAGILSRANRSLVVIDEFDKLNKEDMNGLHTVMEKGEAIVTKAGTHLTLKADTSILACCNPKNGVFLDISGYEAVANQVNIPIPILNRFDLIFFLRDIVDSEKDRKIIRAMFSKNIEPEIPINLFKKYVYFASKLNPTVSGEIITTLEDIYAKLRKVSGESKETQVNSRIIRAVGGMAVANAKIRLASEVTMEDINVAEGLLMSSFESMGFGRNLTGLDKASLYTKTSTKKMELIDEVKKLVKQEIFSGNRNEDNLIKILKESKFDTKQVLNIWEQLKKDGTIFGRHDNLGWME